MIKIRPTQDRSKDLKVETVSKHVMVRNLPPQTFTATDGYWDLARGRFHAAQERHSFLSMDSIPAIDVPLDETRHWTMVSHKMRGRHFAKEHHSRSITEHSDVPPEKRSSWGKVRRRRHIVMGLQSARSLGSSSISVATNSWKQVFPVKSEDGTASPASRRWPVSELSELEAPRWKQAWLHRKNYGRSLPRAQSEPAPTGLTLPSNPKPETLNPKPSTSNPKP